MVRECEDGGGDGFNAAAKVDAGSDVGHIVDGRTARATSCESGVAVRENYIRAGSTCCGICSRLELGWWCIVDCL